MKRRIVDFLFPVESKNPVVRVYSHPRSGTNYLMALLKANFYEDADLSSRGGWGHWSHPQTYTDPVPYGRLFGNHYYPTKNCSGIYIYRDGRAVALSVWKSSNFIHKDKVGISFSEFLRMKLDWFCTPGRRAYIRKWNVAEHWKRHVDEWLANKPDQIMLVSYEDLILEPEKILRRISERFDLVLPEKFKGCDHFVGPSPNKGKIDEWKNYFTEQDLKFFHSIVSDEHKCLFDTQQDKLCN